MDADEFKNIINNNIINNLGSNTTTKSDNINDINDINNTNFEFKCNNIYDKNHKHYNSYNYENIEYYNNNHHYLRNYTSNFTNYMECLENNMNKKCNEFDFKSKLSYIDSLNEVILSKPTLLKSLIPNIINMLNDNDWRVRKNTLDLLGNIGFTKYDLVECYLDNILLKLEDDNPNVVCSAAYSIAKITLNPKCENKNEIISHMINKITNKYILIEIFKNICEIQPNIIKEHIKYILPFFKEDSSVIKINILKILGRLYELEEDVHIDKNTTELIIHSLVGEDDILFKKYAAYLLWKISMYHPNYFVDSIDLLIKLTFNNNINDIKYKNENYEEFVSYLIYTLSQLCSSNPQKFKNLNVGTLIGSNSKVVIKALLNLFYNLSIVNNSLIIRNIWKIYPLIHENDVDISKYAIKIIGNMALYNQKYIVPVQKQIVEKLNDDNELQKEAAIALIKGRCVNKKILTIMINAIKQYDVEFLKEIIEYCPNELLDSLKSEIEKIINENTNSKLADILNLIDNKRNANYLNGSGNSNAGMDGYILEHNNRLSIVMALKSECVEVELEDGKKTYIIPKDNCIETSLSSLLLGVLEINNGNEVESYKLTHEIMIKSLIDDILWESGDELNNGFNNTM